MRPICARCRAFMRPQKNGVYFTERYNGKRNFDRFGQEQYDPSKFEPYKIWSGDLWRCVGCDTQLIVGTGLQPISEQHMEEFKDLRIKLGADKLNIDDFTS